MIKRTVYFGNPAYLSLKNDQLVIKIPVVENSDQPEMMKNEAKQSLPIEDLGVVILDHKQITLTQGLLEKLLANNVAVITCDSSRMPTGLLLPLDSNTLQSERFKHQINASIPLKKQLWQQTISCKIENQAKMLFKKRSCIVKNMMVWSANVLSNDSTNLEARAAAYYWKNTFPSIEGFSRDKDGIPPNNLLNYGYAILRAVIARSLVASGLLPTLGIHHHNKYNAYCLADDIMEPYRPFVDKIVMDIVDSNTDFIELNRDLKAELLQIPVIDVKIGNKRSPLMIAAGITSASLAKCFAGKSRKITYPSVV